MRKALLIVLFLLPCLTFAQTTVPQGGTGTTTVPTGWFVTGSTALRLTAKQFISLVSDVSGMLGVANGGTGSTTLSGILKGNGTSGVGTLLVGTGLNYDGTTLSATASGTVGSGTQGQFPFYNANGSVLTATSTLFLDQSGKLGIGTSTPNQPFSIAGMTTGQTLELTPATNFNGLYGLRLNNASEAQIGGLQGNPSTGEIRLAVASTYFPTFYSSGSERMRIDTTGNVGIATTTPGGLLSVNGVLGATTPLFVIGSSTTGNLLQPLRLLVDSNGKLALGTTSPQQKLDVFDGALRFSFAAPITAPTTALAGLGAGNVPNGTYVYKVQCNNQLGDGFVGATSTPVTVTDNTTNGRVAVTLPVCPESSVTARRLWRSNNNGAAGSWLAFNISTIPNNTTTSFTDNIASPPDNFGALPQDAFDSGYIFGNGNKGYSISANGNSIITGLVATNGGRVTDNNGNIGLGTLFSGVKCGMFVTDNFNLSCNTGYVSAAMTNGSNSAFAASRQSNTVSADMGTGPAGWIIQNSSGNSASSNSSVGYGYRVTTINVTNTGTSIGYGTRNYVQTASLTNYIGFYSTGQFATTNSTVINHFDFRADDFTSLSNGTTTNRYGVYLNFTPTAVNTSIYGIYQVSGVVPNYFGGKVGVGTTTPLSALSISTTTSLGSTSLFAVASSTNATLFNVLGNGFVGIGTTSPTAQLSNDIASSTAGTATTAPVGYVQSMIIAGTRYMLEMFDLWGHFVTGGPAPVISSCGTTPNGSVSGNDRNGTITVGGGVVTSCVLTFAHAYPTAPDCVVSDNSTAIAVGVTSVSATAITTGFSASLGGGQVYYICQAHQ
jgi:hypothetical protein